MATDAFQRTLTEGRTQRPLILIRIDGFGFLDGTTPKQYVICNRMPAYATDPEKYLPILASYPDLLETSIDPLGGIEAPTQAKFSILDLRTSQYPDGMLTAHFADEQKAWRETINQTVNTSQTGFPISSIASVTSNTLVYMNGEAMRITGTTGANVLNVERGVLGTIAQHHPIGSQMFLANPLLLSRKVSLKLCFEHLSEADEHEVDTEYYIRSFDMGEHLHTFEIKASSRQDWFNRELASGQIAGKQQNSYADWQQTGNLKVLSSGGRTANNEIRGFYKRNKFHALLDKELIGVTLGPGDLYAWSSNDRGFLGSSRVKADEVLDAQFRLVAVANKDLDACPFLYQEPGSEVSSINSDQWVKTDHPLKVLLILLTSPLAASDNLHTLNWTTNQGNFSSLPPGWGIGIPANYIDFESFWLLIERYPALRVPNLILADPVNFAEFAEKELLRPFGFILGWEGNQITVRKQRIFSAVFGGEDRSFSESDILMVPGGDAWKPDIQAGKSADTLASEIQFINKTPMDTTNKLTFRDADFPYLFQVSAAPDFNKRFLRLETSGLEFGASGDAYHLETRAAELMYWFGRPVWRVSFRTSISKLLTRVGDFILLSHRDLPRMGTGRDWVNVATVLTKKKLSISPDETSIMWEGVVFDKGETFGALSPSAAIVSIASNAFTVRANRYTMTTVDSTLPATDAGGFRVGWIVQLKRRDFAVVSSTQTITGISGDVITLNGNFGGQAGPGDIIELANYSGQVLAGSPEERGNFIAMAFKNPPRLSATYPDDPIFQYGVY